MFMETPTKIAASKLVDKSQIFKLNHQKNTNMIGQIPTYSVNLGFVLHELGFVRHFVGQIPTIVGHIPTHVGEIPKKKKWDLSCTSWDLS
jgi:hypothetical protein